jgi:hypothetical protein
MNTPITLKDLLIGFAIGAVFIFVSNVVSTKVEPKQIDNLENKIITLERNLSKMEGESNTYKRWIDSITPMLSQEQRLNLLKKM